MSSPEIVEWLNTTPVPKSTPTESDYVDSSEVASLIKSSSDDIVIIDLRKNDYVGGKIKGALNIPYTSITNSIGDLYRLLSKAGIKQIIIHCVSSRDRATRTWGWFNDYQNKNAEGANKIKITILKGGFKAFAENYSDLIEA